MEENRNGRYKMREDNGDKEKKVWNKKHRMRDGNIDVRLKIGNGDKNKQNKS